MDKFVDRVRRAPPRACSPHAWKASSFSRWWGSAQSRCNIPSLLQPAADALIQCTQLERYPDKISWSAETREVSMNGRRLPGSIIDNIIAHAVRSLKCNRPDYETNCGQMLAELNVPVNYIRNTYYKEQYAQLQNENQDLSRTDSPSSGTPIGRRRNLYQPLHFLPMT